MDRREALAALTLPGMPYELEEVELGPFLEDRTTLRLAACISELTGGCPRPALAQ